MRNLIGLDFETYSWVNLPVHGLHRYVNHHTFRSLLASVTWRESPSMQLSRRRLDFVAHHDSAVWALRELIDDSLIVAHNAPFEQAVLGAIGIHLPSNRFIDSAVLARAAGAAGKLEAGAPQLLGIDKVEAGRDLMKLFSIPGKYQEANDSHEFDPAVVADHPEEWDQYGHYCDIDSELGLRIAELVLPDLPSKELENQAVTMDMNLVGWPVDLATVEEMQRRYLENIEVAEAMFRARFDAHDLNFGSLKQMKEWCEERGIKAKSFDEKAVAKMIERIEKKLDGYVHAYQSGAAKPDKYDGYVEVLELLRTKQILGGSSLKKLQTILDTTSEDGRLRDQYLHVGAGQSFRTSGRGVQMQNLKRLGGEPDDMLELQDLEIEWDNDKLATNIRQCFTSSHPQGALIVGDFSSVESRGLAWQAGAIDKLEAFRKGLDIYKVGAAKQYSVAYDAVTKDQRQFGKVGELSCGYQAGGGAVQSFAEGMGVMLTEGEANMLVSDWRAANPEIERYWWDLDEALHRVVELHTIETIRIGPDKDWRVVIYPEATPKTLDAQHPRAQSVGVEVRRPNGELYLRRIIHGCYVRGKNICYYKPSELKSGDLWKNHFTDPKTKQVRFYSIYGGKLAGILTQSFCRELFFDTLRKVHDWVGRTPGLDLIGQFHDEIVLDWTPACTTSLEGAKQMLESSMSATDVRGFPLAAEVKHDYRYTK